MTDPFFGEENPARLDYWIAEARDTINEYRRLIQAMQSGMISREVIRTSDRALWLSAKATVQHQVRIARKMFGERARNKITELEKVDLVIRELHNTVRTFNRRRP